MIIFWIVLQFISDPCDTHQPDCQYYIQQRDTLIDRSNAVLFLDSLLTTEPLEIRIMP